MNQRLRAMFFRTSAGVLGVLGCVATAAANPAPTFKVAADVALPFDAHWVVLAPTATSPRLIADRTVIDATSKGWVRRPAPDGLITPGPDGTLVLAERAGSGRLRLEATGWVATTAGRALPRGVHGPSAFDTNGKLVAFGDNFTALWRETADGSFTRTVLPPRTVLNSWAGPGSVFAVSQNGIIGTTTLPTALGSLTGHPAGGVDRRGAPAFAWSSPGALRLRHAGGEAALVIGGDDRRPDPLRCRDQACPYTQRWVDFASSTGVFARDDELLVPFVDTSFTEQLRCTPNPEPMHPCDPGGPGRRCAPREPYVCSGPRTLRGTLALMRVVGKRAERVTLPAIVHPRDRGPDLLAAARDPAGRLHLVLRWQQDDQLTTQSTAELRYVVLSERDERYAIPSTLLPATSAALSTLTSTNLGLAGFVDQSQGWPIEARYQNGEVRSGGVVGPAWWLADVSAPAERATIGLEASLAVTLAGCGRPGLSLQFGTAKVGVYIKPEGLELELPGREVKPLPRSTLPTKLRVELSRTRSAIVVDGAVVETGAGLGKTTLPGLATFGDLAGCTGPRSAARWRSLRLDR